MQINRFANFALMVTLGWSFAACYWGLAILLDARSWWVHATCAIVAFSVTVALSHTQTLLGHEVTAAGNDQNDSSTIPPFVGIPVAIFFMLLQIMALYSTADNFGTKRLSFFDASEDAQSIRERNMKAEKAEREIMNVIEPPTYSQRAKKAEKRLNNAISEAEKYLLTINQTLRMAESISQLNARHLESSRELMAASIDYGKETKTAASHLQELVDENAKLRAEVVVLKRAEEAPKQKSSASSNLARGVIVFAIALILALAPIASSYCHPLRSIYNGR